MVFLSETVFRSQTVFRYGTVFRFQTVFPSEMVVFPVWDGIHSYEQRMHTLRVRHIPEENLKSLYKIIKFEINLLLTAYRLHVY